MNYRPARYAGLNNLEPPPYASDVENSLGPYPHQEVVEARATLIHTVQSENNGVWRNIKGKCGILPDGHRVRCQHFPQVWLPQEIPESWFSPISLVHVIEDDQQEEISANGKTSRRKSDTSAGRQNKTCSDGNPVVISVDCGQEDEAIVIHDSSTPQREIPDLKRAGNEKEKQNREIPVIVELESSSSTGSGHSESDSIYVVTTEHSEPGNHNITHGSNTGNGKIKQNHLVENQPSMLQVNGDKTVPPVPFTTYDNDFEVWGLVPEKHVTMYKCDVCPFTFLRRADAEKHLVTYRHYSASSCLGRKSGSDSKSLIPIYVSAVSVLKCQYGLFNRVVPVCPKCFDVFPDIAACCDHTHRVHGMCGSYSLRNVKMQRRLMVSISARICTECGQTFKSKKLKKHWKVTGHMPVNVPTKCASEMTFFVCGICASVYYSFLQCRDHIYRAHVNQETTVTAYTLEPATQVLQLLPFEPEKQCEGIIGAGDMAAATKEHKRKFQFQFQQSFKKMRQEIQQL